MLRLRITLLRREFKPEHLDALDKTVGQIGELVARLQEFNVQRTEEQLTDVHAGHRRCARRWSWRAASWSSASTR